MGHDEMGREELSGECTSSTLIAKGGPPSYWATGKMSVISSPPCHVYTGPRGGEDLNGS
jgi:hypothetical protein